MLSGAKYLLSSWSASEKWAKFGEFCEFRMAFIWRLESKADWCNGNRILAKTKFSQKHFCVKDVSYIFNISTSMPSLSTKREGYFSILVFNLAERWEREAIWQILPGADTCPSARMTLLMCDLSRSTWTKRQAGSANVCFSGAGWRRGGATRPRLSRRHLLAVEQLVEPTLSITITFAEHDVLACNR